MLTLRNRMMGLWSGIALAAVLSLGWADQARAALYAYSVQQTSGYNVTGATVGTFSPNSSTSAAQITLPPGFDAHSGTFDALQAYVGPGAGKPAENTFTPKGMTDPDFSRGDALIGTAALTTNNVAEMFLTNAGNASASGAWSVSAPLTVASTSAVSVSFNFTNQLVVTHGGSPAGAVQGSYSYILSIQDVANNTVFTSAPSSLNRTAGLIAAGAVNLPASGTVTVTSGSLTAGTYTLTLSGTETVFGNLVPEPGSCLMLAGAGIMNLARRRR